MELRQLRYFRAVVQERSFSRAARRCFVAQPSLSQQIGKLEEEAGEPLFVRDRSGVRLTSAGEALWARAAEVLGSVEEIERTFSQREGSTSGVVAFGAIPTVAPYFLPTVLRAFRETHPAVALDLSEGTTAEVARLVLAGDLAFAVVSTLDEPLSGLTLEELFSEPMLVALPAWHVLASRPEIRSGDLACEPLLLLKEGHCLKNQVLRTCRAHDFDPRGGARCDQLSTLLGLISAGCGFSLVPEMAARGSAGHGEGLVFRRLADTSPVRPISLLRRTAEKLTGPAAVLAGVIRRHSAGLR